MRSHTSFYKPHIFIILLISICISQSVFSADVDTTFKNSNSNQKQNSPDNKIIFAQLYDDANFFFHQPDFYAVVGGISLMPVVFKKGFDTEEPEYTEMWGNSQFADNIFEFGELFGDGQFAYALSVSSYGLGKMIKNRSMSSFGTDLFRAQTMNALFVLSIKGVINRPRPNGAPYSYPSGHTSSTFATAGVIYKHFGKNYGIPALLVAGYVGFSRLQENKHYITDIIAGGIVGTYVSFKLCSSENKNKSIAVSPLLQKETTGLSLTLLF